MFGLGITIPAFLGKAQKAGLTASALSPVTLFLEKFGQGWTEDSNDITLPVSAEEFDEAMQILHRPEAVIVARYGGNLVNPEETRFAVAGKGQGMRLVVMEPMAPSGLFIQYFDSLENWGEWVLDRVDPLRIARERNRLIPAGKLSWKELLHLLHSADMVRRCYYQSMLDQTPVEAFEFSDSQYMEALHSAILSVDWRWLVPCMISMVPGGVPDSLPGLKDGLECLKRFGLIADSDSGLMTFTEAGQELGMEFMWQWVSALGLEVVTGSGQVAEGGRWLALGTNAGTHLFAFEKQTRDVEINYHIAGESGVKESLKRLLEGVKTADSEVLRQTPPLSQTAPAGTFCTQCGHKLEDGSRFCPSCGAKV